MFSHSSGNEYYFIAFIIVGVIAGLLLKKRKVIVEKVEVPVETSQENFVADEKAIEKSGISARELEILQLISDGLSNQQMAEKLFISESTIKKHISNLFFKLDVSRRTEAVKKAKDLHIIK